MQDTKNISSPAPGTTAVVVGRWQIAHKGHETLFQTALATAERVIVVIGSAFHARDTHNPFNWQERKAMVQATLSVADKERVSFLPVRDYFDDARWNEAVSKGVAAIAPKGPITLVGFQKDHTSYYLENFPSWARFEVAQAHASDATALRKVFFEGKDHEARLAVLEPFLHPGVLAYLQAWALLPAYTERAVEHMAVEEYRKKWTATSYLTADAVIRASGHVLLVRRGGAMGHGLWALPGGFVNDGERFYPAAVREAKEETRFEVLSSTMKAALRGSQVFDHPGRSARARLVTNAFYFDFGNMRLPEVEGRDDAMEARWVRIEELPGILDQFFEDHACILEHFLGTFSDVPESV